MPPATSPWPVIITAVITAGAAFLGVVVAQLWTSRREKRQWERQMQMYATQWADQRERDREQRKDERERDERAWRRENKFRFADQRRELYADFLNAIEKFTEQAVEARSSGEHFNPDRMATLDRIGLLTTQLFLIAPPNVAQLANGLVKSHFNGPTDTGEHLLNLYSARIDLMQAMSAELRDLE